jgi:hypothetical protein
MWTIGLDVPTDATGAFSGTSQLTAELEPEFSELVRFNGAAGACATISAVCWRISGDVEFCSWCIVSTAFVELTASVDDTCLLTSQVWVALGTN